jgi:SAM-dependent methyltransferase
MDLARDGHWVTVSDLDAERIASLHAGLDAKVAGRLTLVDRPYGEASFAPSSFDLVLLADALHTYREPQWLVHKALRELKPDALLALRVLVQGPLPQMPAGTRAAVPASGAQALAERAGEQVLRHVESLLRSPAGALLAGPVAREALDRGAHLHTDRFAPQAEGVLQAVASVLRLEEVRVGHTLRLRLADALFGLRGPLCKPLLRALRAVPEEATDIDRLRTGPRVLGLIARRALTLRSPG